ncbi:MAG TPA: N-acetyltransferase [bacterium]|nr:N-acetyltransferase [bacterium]HOL47225.1 N-acetyltransferase [bacterium]HPQ18266.1 N-acetyltransferase [bacterium]
MIRKATFKDIEKIHSLITNYSNQGKMLPRSLNSLFDNLRDFVVVIDDKTDNFIGCGALHISWYELGEIKSLAVLEEYKRKGIGREIVKFLLEEAKKLHLKKVFALTYVPEFFIKLGFEKIDKNLLPHKIWSDCINCSKFPNCDEIAVIKIID